MKAPTDEQIANNAWIEWIDTRGRSLRGFACWYPQIGGYVARCIVVPISRGAGDQGFCFDAFVWHDGEFPFSDEDRSPAMLHHCSANQFIEFGELVLGKAGV